MENTVNQTREQKKAYIFFIGGAADKKSYYGVGPFYLMQKVQKLFEERAKDILTRHHYATFYLGFDEIEGQANIKQSVLTHIAKEQAIIYIVGLSLGAWNGAHLAQILIEQGWHVAMLITLDPVGTHVITHLLSNISKTIPQPKVPIWINVRAKPTWPDVSDFMAFLGGKWQIPHATIDSEISANHVQADRLFSLPFQNKSAADWLFESIQRQCQLI